MVSEQKNLTKRVNKKEQKKEYEIRVLLVAFTKIQIGIHQIRQHVEKRQIVCQIVIFWQETVVQIFQTTRRQLYEKPASKY